VVFLLGFAAVPLSLTALENSAEITSGILDERSIPAAPGSNFQ